MSINPPMFLPIFNLEFERDDMQNVISIHLRVMLPGGRDTTMNINNSQKISDVFSNFKSNDINDIRRSYAFVQDSNEGFLEFVGHGLVTKEQALDSLESFSKMASASHLKDACQTAQDMILKLRGLRIAA